MRRERKMYLRHRERSATHVCEHALRALRSCWRKSITTSMISGGQSDKDDMVVREEKLFARLAVAK